MKFLVTSQIIACAVLLSACQPIQPRFDYSLDPALAKNTHITGEGQKSFRIYCNLRRGNHQTPIPFDPRKDYYYFSIIDLSPLTAAPYDGPVSFSNEDGKSATFKAASSKITILLEANTTPAWKEFSHIVRKGGAIAVNLSGKTHIIKTRSRPNFFCLGSEPSDPVQTDVR